MGVKIVNGADVYKIPEVADVRSVATHLHFSEFATVMPSAIDTLVGGGVIDLEEQTPKLGTEGKITIINGSITCDLIWEQDGSLHLDTPEGAVELAADGEFSRKDFQLPNGFTISAVEGDMSYWDDIKWHGPVLETVPTLYEKLESAQKNIAYTQDQVVEISDLATSSSKAAIWLNTVATYADIPTPADDWPKDMTHMIGVKDTSSVYKLDPYENTGSEDEPSLWKWPPIETPYLAGNGFAHKIPRSETNISSINVGDHYDFIFFDTTKVTGDWDDASAVTISFFDSPAALELRLDTQSTEICWAPGHDSRHPGEIAQISHYVYDDPVTNWNKDPTAPFMSYSDSRIIIPIHDTVKLISRPIDVTKLPWSAMSFGKIPSDLADHVNDTGRHLNIDEKGSLAHKAPISVFIRDLKIGDYVDSIHFDTSVPPPQTNWDPDTEVFSCERYPLGGDHGEPFASVFSQRVIKEDETGLDWALYHRDKFGVVTKICSYERIFGVHDNDNPPPMSWNPNLPDSLDVKGIVSKFGMTGVTKTEIFQDMFQAIVLEDLSNHTNKAALHVSAEDRAKWDGLSIVAETIDWTAV